MKLLLDTHVLLWAATGSRRLSKRATSLIRDPGNELFFSAASIWEAVIKHGLGRGDFEDEPALLRQGLLYHGYAELPVTSEHALVVARLPKLHRDPFDRMLVAQALADSLTLLTADNRLASYHQSIIKV